jgi:hypothetical protein
MYNAINADTDPHNNNDDDDEVFPPDGIRDQAARVGYLMIPVFEGEDCVCGWFVDVSLVEHAR